MKNNFKINIIDSVQDVHNDNVDVEITLNGVKYVLTFFTLDNIKMIMDRYQNTGECLGGTYFRAIEMIIVRDLNESTIYSTVSGIIESGELSSYYQGEQV